MHESLRKKDEVMDKGGDSEYSMDSMSLPPQAEERWALAILWGCNAECLTSGDARGSNTRRSAPKSAAKSKFWLWKFSSHQRSIEVSLDSGASTSGGPPDAKKRCIASSEGDHKDFEEGQSTSGQAAAQPVVTAESSSAAGQSNDPKEGQ